VLSRNRIPCTEVADARKASLAEEEAWQVLAAAREIVVAKGRKQLVFDPRRDSREAILKETLGRCAPPPCASATGCWWASTTSCTRSSQPEVGS
jgi:hypothetical protein